MGMLLFMKLHNLQKFQQISAGLPQFALVRYLNISWLMELYKTAYDCEIIAFCMCGTVTQQDWLGINVQLSVLHLNQKPRRKGREDFLPVPAVMLYSQYTDDKK